jgi:hypothetical protein
MGKFSATFILDFFVAFGMVVGGSILGGISALFFNQPPLATMERLAEQLKIWALVAAVGGTFDVLRVIETGFLGGQLSPVAKQLLYLLSAFIGAQLGTVIIAWLAKVR